MSMKIAGKMRGVVVDALEKQPARRNEFLLHLVEETDQRGAVKGIWRT
jgi:hypothetical protein